MARSLGFADHYDYSGIYNRPEERTSFMTDLDVFVMHRLRRHPNSIVEAMATGNQLLLRMLAGFPI